MLQFVIATLQYFVSDSCNEFIHVVLLRSHKIQLIIIIIVIIINNSSNSRFPSPICFCCTVLLVTLPHCLCNPIVFDTCIGFGSDFCKVNMVVIVIIMINGGVTVHWLIITRIKLDDEVVHSA